METLYDRMKQGWGNGWMEMNQTLTSLVLCYNPFDILMSFMIEGA